MKVRKNIIVSGQVQGVAFRNYTRMTAQGHGVNGWVRNLPNGDVEGCFEGEELAVQQLVEWCRRGPASARVDRLQLSDGSFTGEFSSFEIRF